MVDRARRAWLKGSFGKPRGVLRPPGAGPDAEFTDRCTRCDDCLPACPRNLIRRGDGGFPELDPGRGGCDFCGACAAVCAVAALRPAIHPWRWRVAADDRCLALRGVSCRSCGDCCERGALGFRLAVGGSARLEINPDLCNGCGECIGICPAHSLSLVPALTKESASNALSRQ